ncbi:MAG TPA: hypothetical protein DCY13_24775 [Verrucomicrobiales bacterium]|nr:hypothetical protein [Verrucomicrobiales bacterium]
MNPMHLPSILSLAIVGAILTGCKTLPRPQVQRPAVVAKWSPFEAAFQAQLAHADPFQEIDLTVTFVAPDGERFTVPGFWNGGRDWRVRFAPNLAGTWSFQTVCSNPADAGLHGQSGEFLCTAPALDQRFTRHGFVEIARDGRHLVHDDLTPFFWLADTAWNGALHSTDEEWAFYLKTRAEQKFTAVQWVATQWRAAPNGDLNGRAAFTGSERIVINHEFFARLDRKARAVAEAGLLNAPVLLWAIGGGSDPKVNPGFSLPEDQAIRLARYMVARWQAFPVVWMLPGDGDYRGEKAERWKRIGRAVFGGIHHAPTTLHPGGRHWNLPEFQHEDWLDMVGYQSGHGDDDATLRWIFDGPATRDWSKEPPRPFINLEPAYENHLAYQSKQPHSAANVRQAVYWSLLNAPTAGVSYGGHGVWGWDDGSGPPTDHAGSGTPLPWREALRMPAAEQLRHAYDLFTELAFWRLRPAPDMLAVQPGREAPSRHIAIARSEQGEFAVAYIPSDRSIHLRLNQLPGRPQMTWVNPRDGSRHPSVGVLSGDTLQLPTPSEGDWLLLIRAGQ